MSIRRGWVITAIAVAVSAVIAVGVFVVQRKGRQREVVAAPKPEAPPDLEKLRGVYVAGLDALHQGDGAVAVQRFSSFSFKKRAVEQYRFYYLANAYQLIGDRKRARTTLAELWSRTPRLVPWVDTGLNLGNLYSAIADWQHAADVYAGVAERADDSNVAGNARWSALESRFALGDIGAVLFVARNLAIKNPRANPAGEAIAVVRSLTSVAEDAPIRLTEAERLERAVSLMRDGDPGDALTELVALDGVAAPLRIPVQLNRGLALNKLRRFDESNRVLEPLGSTSYRFAIPAIYTLAQNYRALSASINPMVNKVIVVRQQVGTTKTRVGKGKKRRLVTKPKFAKVKKTIQVVDPAKKAKKDEYERLGAERLKDLLQLPLADDVRIEVLNTLIAIAESKNQDDYEQGLIKQLQTVDPSQEGGLQHFWDKAWAAYARGDLNGALPVLEFLRDSYRNSNVKRQAAYWMARVDDRLGRKEQAAATYRDLAQAPYDDIYAVESERRGAKRQAINLSPLTMNRPDWRDIAEQNMPSELRLAYELTALTDMRSALLEIRVNRNRANQPFADALQADLYNSTGNFVLMMLTLKRAFPALATVEQDSVPPYFLKMYYPMRYEDAIIRYSEKNQLDSYIVMGLIHQESHFHSNARSAVGAIGLMQLMPATGRELAGRLGIRSRLDDAETNIRLGTTYFRMLVNMFGGTTELAIAAYNAGQGRVLQWRRAAPGRPLDEFIESIPFRETRTYVKHVVMLASAYRRMYPR